MINHALLDFVFTSLKRSVGTQDTCYKKHAERFWVSLKNSFIMKNVKQSQK